MLPHPGRFRLALLGAWLAKPFAGLMPGRIKGLMKMAPARVEAASPVDRPGTHAAQGTRRKRVILMSGCAQQVLRPAINEATVRLLTRLGCEVVVTKGAGCCGALVHHMGREHDAQSAARANVAAWTAANDEKPVDAIIVNASGCGTTVKDYGFMLRADTVWAEKAGWVAEKTRDVTEFLAEIGIDTATGSLTAAPVVTYHSACSMQHGQKITRQPKALLEAAGFQVKEPREGHLCCGSAGTYNIMQPELAARLRQRKLANLREAGGTIVATGNIGCLEQLSGGDGNGRALPVVHTVELLDWATGGPRPPGID